MEPMYTSDTSGERSGMGFSFMEAFMDRSHSPYTYNQVTEDAAVLGDIYGLERSTLSVSAST